MSRGSVDRAGAGSDVFEALPKEHPHHTENRRERPRPGMMASEKRGHQLRHQAKEEKVGRSEEEAGIR